MPYKLRKSGPGFFVVNEKSGRKLSKKPLSRQRAMSQMKAVYARERGQALDCSKPKNKKYITCQKRSRKLTRSKSKVRK